MIYNYNHFPSKTTCIEKNNEVHEVTNNYINSEMELDFTTIVDQVATANNNNYNNNNLSSQPEGHLNTNSKEKQNINHRNHNILSIDDNPLQLSTNDIGMSTTIEHNKPLVKCKVQSLTFDALLDACSTGPEGYIVNYIHPDIVHKIKTHQTSVKKPIIKKCNCVRASTCTGAGCFETSTCVTLNIHLFDEVEEIEINNINFRVSKGIPYDIIIGNFTFRDYDLSKIFRHFFVSNNHQINQSSHGRSSNSSKESEVENIPSHEKRRVASISSYPASEKLTIGLRRSNRLARSENLQPSASDLRVESMDIRRLGTLWLNNIILKEDIFAQERDDTFEDEIPSNPIEDILNNVSDGWDDQSTDLKIQDVLGNVYDKQLKIKILPLLQECIDIFRKEFPATPAKIEPMKLTLIEGSDWYINRKNKQAPRSNML